jgi:hypothetical protein
VKPILLSLCLVFTLSACGGSDDQEATGAIPEHQLDAMDKAQDVEAALQEAEQQRREQLDNQ